MNRKSARYKSTDSIEIEGRQYRIQRSERLRNRRYLLLERLAPAPRERWLAYNTAGGQLCSFLVLPSNRSAVQRINVLRRIERNAVPRIIEWSRDATKTRIVMPWVEGITVQEYLARIKRGKVAPPEPFHALRLILELARGLNALHRHAQIIHGDVKPANLILTHKPSHLTLIDFGSGWLSSKTGFRAEGDGTSDLFSAPEVRTNGIINDRVDQFSAMVVLYMLLTGVIPYEGLGGKAGWPQYADDAPAVVAPSQCPLSRKFLPRKYWREIDALVLQGMSLNPRERFAHSMAWVDTIEDVFLKLRVHRSVSRCGPRSILGRLADRVAERFYSTNYRERENE